METSKGVAHQQQNESITPTFGNWFNEINIHVHILHLSHSNWFET